MLRNVVATFAWAVIAASSFAAEPVLRQGDLVAVVGDSITEQRLYSVYMQDYLLMCQPAKGVNQAQFGWSGETAHGYAGRMANDTLRFHPTVMTTCFGMNDGQYSPMTPEKAERYRNAMQSIVDQAKAAGVRALVIGSPGCVDSHFFGGSSEASTMYNQTLAELRDIARDVAKKNGLAFANVHDAMIEAMTKAKAKFGDEYHVGGGDGVHPDCNGQFVMAYAFLKGMGCDGEIARIEFDLAKNKATASGGHKVLSSKQGAIELESSRYPFCFSGEAGSPSGTLDMATFTPFQDELNRFTLMVKGLSTPKAMVRWGDQEKEFSKEDLEKGVNLAAEFLENPFCGPFAEVEAKIRAQQEFETPLVKEFLTRLPGMKALLPDQADAIEKLAAQGVEKSRALAHEAASAVKPVKHTIVVTAVK